MTSSYTPYSPTEGQRIGESGCARSRREMRIDSVPNRVGLFEHARHFGVRETAHTVESRFEQRLVGLCDQLVDALSELRDGDVAIQQCIGLDVDADLLAQARQDPHREQRRAAE